MSCILCLETNSKTASKTEFIDIYSEEGLQLEVNTIIRAHFCNIKLNEFNKSASTQLQQQKFVCKVCWHIVKDFHELYERVVEAHQNCLQTASTGVAIATNDNCSNDELLCPIITSRAQSVANFEQSQNALNVNAIEEIKLEVNELELLPRLEIIEGAVDCASERALRANKRNRKSDNIIFKRVKKELSLNIDTDLTHDIFDETELSKNIDLMLPDTNITISSKTKFNSQYSATKKCDRPKENDDEINLENKYKQNIDANNRDDDGVSNEDDFDYAALQYTTDTTASVDTENSWSGQLQKEKYAIIYKKVPIKPKKYRKHPKPLTPPKRMTRDEIDARHARQMEYDTVIGKFFENMRCPKCQLLVRCFGDMRAHFRISHNDDHGYVECCGRRFITRKTLAEHVYVHWNPEHFKCSTCGKPCLDSKQLESHENSHLPNPPPSKYKKVFHCDKCPKTFSSKASFEHHSFAKHVPKEEFKFHCPQCNKKLPTDRKLKEHLKHSHDAQNAVICDKCGKTLKSGYSLKKHSEIEHSDKPKPMPEPRQCEICGTWLRHIAGLKQHLKSMHEDTKMEHRCHICNKTSSTSRALKRHIYHNHECARKFKCTMCEKAFKRAQDLREHISVHTGEVLYTCPNCPMTFFSNANMYKHRQRLHRAEWEADRKKPIPPNIMGQAKEGSKIGKLKRSDGIIETTTTANITKSCQENKELPSSPSTIIYKSISDGNIDLRYENLEFI